MNIEEAIREEIKKLLHATKIDSSDLHKKLEEIHSIVCLLANTIVMRQDLASQSTKISPETLRRKERAGEINALSPPASRLIFYQLKQLSDLAPKVRGKVQRRRRK